jgi:hypothetical protein
VPGLAEKINQVLLNNNSLVTPTSSDVYLIGTFEFFRRTAWGALSNSLTMRFIFFGDDKLELYINDILIGTANFATGAEVKEPTVTRPSTGYMHWKFIYTNSGTRDTTPPPNGNPGYFGAVAYYGPGFGTLYTGTQNMLDASLW